MNRTLVVVTLSVTLFAAVTGCGRHVVVEPETADRANDHAWKITSEPGRTVVIQGGPAVPSTSPTPSSMGAGPRPAQ